MKHGLKKVVKTVRGKHGSYRRTYNVRPSDSMSAGKFLRKHGATWAGVNALTGLAGGVGGVLGHRLGRHKKIGSGAIGGYAIGSLGTAAALGSTRRMRELEQDSRRLGIGGHLVMSGVGVVSHVAGATAGLLGAHKVLRPRTIGRPHEYDAERYGTTRFALPHIASQIESDPRYRKR